MEKILELRTKYSKTYQRVWFDVPLLRQPAWQQITLLPESYQAIHEDNINTCRPTPVRTTGYTYSRTSRFRRCNEISHTGEKMRTQVRKIKELYAFFNEHDRRRQTNFLNTFLRWKNFMRSARNA